jgi:hypothetical protein
MVAIDTQMIEDPAAQYQAGTQQHAEKTLGTVARATQAGVACEMVRLERKHP